MILPLAILIYLICSTTGLLLLKGSLGNQSVASFSDFIKIWQNWKFIAGFFLYATSFLTWLFILSKKDLSIIFPIVIGLSYIAVFLSALIFLQEEATSWKIFAALLIGTGVIIISIQK